MQAILAISNLVFQFPVQLRSITLGPAARSSKRWHTWAVTRSTLGKYSYPVYLAEYIIYIYLVGGIPTPLKNMKVSWDDYSQYMEK